MISPCNGVNPICPDSLAVRPFRFTASLLQGESGLSSNTATMKTTEQRFWSKVNKETVVTSPYVDTPCWVWTASLKEKGYGQYSIAGKPCLAYKYSYEQNVGKVPDYMTIDHICRNRPCVRPDHLRLLTQKQNNEASDSLTALNGRKTTCKNGHPLVGDHIKIDVRKDGTRRRCSLCDAINRKNQLERIRNEKLTRATAMKESGL